ncbi:hypothetical protein BD311DRAFT_123422 [Dichomitus squalens]|uniref:Uncharacterized protein n=1 Tax=Dichomitus squalens TaxID=114155 RepID=A0A4Q9M703_9APHY|nr:hypothetical protein BD311DRAFT_123422 [Dichomitus squalens]
MYLSPLQVAYDALRVYQDLYIHGIMQSAVLGAHASNTTTMANQTKHQTRPAPLPESDLALLSGLPPAQLRAAASKRILEYRLMIEDLTDYIRQLSTIKNSADVPTSSLRIHGTPTWAPILNPIHHLRLPRHPPNLLSSCLADRCLLDSYSNKFVTAITCNWNPTSTANVLQGRRVYT